ncbi:MAG: MFS transporter [Oligoflexia bacterium]
MSAFSIPDFRKLVTARLLFSIAVQMQAVVMAWEIYSIHKDPLYLGLIGLAEAVPSIGLALFAGYVVDRGNPVRIYQAVLVLSLISVMMLIFSNAGHSSSEQRSVALYAAAFLTGLARGFAAPSVFSITPQIVPRQALAVSSAWLTSAFQVAAVGGPAVGGLLYAWMGARGTFVLQAVLLVLALIVFSMIGLKPTIQRRVKGEALLENLLSGMRFVFRHELLLSALALDMFAVLFGGATALLPIFASEILNVGPQGLGILRAAPAVGALLMGVALIRKPISHGAGKILLACVAGYGLCVIGFGISRIFWLSTGLLALGGALDCVSMVLRGTIVSLYSPEDMRGRVASVNAIFIGSSNELGALESGIAAKLLGTVPAVLLGGAMTLLVVGITGVKAKTLRKLNLD